MLSSPPRAGFLFYFYDWGILLSLSLLSSARPSWSFPSPCFFSPMASFLFVATSHTVIISTHTRIFVVKPPQSEYLSRTYVRFSHTRNVYLSDYRQKLDILILGLSQRYSASLFCMASECRIDMKYKLKVMVYCLSQKYHQIAVGRNKHIGG